MPDELYTACPKEILSTGFMKLLGSLRCCFPRSQYLRLSMVGSDLHQTSQEINSTVPSMYVSVGAQAADLRGVTIYRW
jgi:hypothetical protein